MIFPSEKKKELLRYATRNNPATCDADGTQMPTQPPQPHLHPHRPHPQLHSQSQSQLSDSCCCLCASDSATATMRQLNTPPPPYCLIPCSIDCSGSYRLPQHVNPQPAHDQVTDMSVESDCSYITGGSSYASSGADLLSDENDEHYPPPPQAAHTMDPVRLLPTTTAAAAATATTFAATAASMFRNCCGGGGHTTDSSSNGSLVQRNSPQSGSRRYFLNHRQRTVSSTSPTCPLHPHGQANIAGGAGTTTTITTTAMRHRTLSQNLNALLKPFKNKQINELLQAVRSRVDPPSAKSNAGNNVISSSPSYLQCILIKCTSGVDEEQHVTTCQMFFWSDLRGGGELRRLPTCPSARDYVYVCCNPLHWYRIIQPIDSESAPPPYQRSKMLRLRDTDSEANTQNVDRSTGVAWSTDNVGLGHSHHSHSQSISSIIKQAESQLYVPSLESFTTDGKDRSACSKVWCQIAYWELAQRVGEFFHAKKPTVNIYGEGPVDCGGGDSMCLRDLGGKRPPSDAVQNTRQKVGLGVTLSLESDDVWIYNRSNVPIFVDSPTLAERQPSERHRVCKVLPGYCLKAFETQRAQWLACKQSQHNPQLGPIDRFSMKISFAKGWGKTYKRQDVMGCPCWLEVHFNHLR